MHRLLRLAILTESFPRLSETFVVQLALECHARGHDVTILSLLPGERAAVTDELSRSRLLDRVIHLDVPQSRGMRLAASPRAIVDLIRRRRNPIALLRVGAHGRSVLNLRGLLAGAAMARHRATSTYDVVHAHFGKNGLLALQLRDAGLIDGEIITTFHGQDATAYPKMLGSDVYDPLFRSGSLVTTASSFIAECLQRLGAPERQVTWLPMPFDSTRFTFHARTAPADGVVRLLTVGRLVEKKGIDDVLTAVARLTHEYGATVHCEIAGDGPLLPALRERVGTLEINDAVTFLGPLPPEQIRRAYERAHLFVLASATARDGDHEGLGVVLLEAQACGLPVVATRHDGFPDAVVEGESAILVDEHQPDQLTSALIELIRTPERWADMGRAGHDHVHRSFAREVAGDRLTSLVEQRIGTHGIRP